LFLFASIYIIGIKTIYKTVKEYGYWLCIITTLAITIFSAYLLLPVIDNIRLLWLIAFLNGIICGIVAEALRRGIEWLFCHTKKGKNYILIKKWGYIKNFLSPLYNVSVKIWYFFHFKEFFSCAET